MIAALKQSKAFKMQLGLWHVVGCNGVGALGRGGEGGGGREMVLEAILSFPPDPTLVLTIPPCY